MATVLEWALLELVRHPHVRQRLRAEIDAKFGMHRPVKEEEAVVKEVLRLHNATTLGLHCNMEDATLARICPGRALAMRVLSAAVGSFVHAFEWSALPGVELTVNEGTNGLNIRHETPLLLREACALQPHFTN